MQLLNMALPLKILIFYMQINQHKKDISPRYLDKTDMLIAALLAIVLILSIFVVSLYVRWKRVTKRFTHAVGPTRKQSHSSLERVVTVTH